MDSSNIRLFLVFGGFFLGGALYSILVSLITKNTIARYLPSLLGILLLAYNVFKLLTVPDEGFLHIGYVLTMVLIGLVMLGNIILNLIIRARRRT